MADGTPVDVILNPLGVSLPYERRPAPRKCHLGWAAACGWDRRQGFRRVRGSPFFTATPVFDGAARDKIARSLTAPIRTWCARQQALRRHMRPGFHRQLDGRGKTRPPVRQRSMSSASPSPWCVTILKLRPWSTTNPCSFDRPYHSLVTQRPTGGRLVRRPALPGEMEVWALYARRINVLRETTHGQVRQCHPVASGTYSPS